LVQRLHRPTTDDDYCCNDCKRPVEPARPMRAVRSSVILGEAKSADHGSTSGALVSLRFATVIATCLMLMIGA
jgi:hypothetical protein